MDIIRESLQISEDIKLFPDVYFGGMNWVVLDIETLGLSPGRAPAILCGIVKPAAQEALVSPQTAEMIQFFTESISGTDDEESMLTALEESLSDVDILVTYNGRQFDLPYLAARRKKIRMPAMRPRFDLDLLPVVRYCTDIGKFVPNLRQKTLEDFCGIWDGRTDEISGRESISLYYDYLTSRDEAVRDTILLHNRDDIVQLYRLTDLLRRADMHKAAFRYGFPVKAGEGKNADRGPLLIVQKIELKNGFLTASGLQSGAPVSDVRYGDERPSWRFLDDTFTLSVPVLEHEKLLLADMDEIDAPLDPALITAGYVVLSQGRDVQYEHCCLLVKAVLTRIIESY